MTGKDVAFIMLFILFILSVIGNALLIPYFIGSDQTERDLKQQIISLEAEQTYAHNQYEREIDELEDEKEDLEEEIETLESDLEQLRRELDSQSGTTISYEELVTSLRTRIYELESETLQLQSDLSECRSQRSPQCCSYPYWCDPCDPCYCRPYYGCYHSVSVSNVSGTYGGHAYDAIIYVYFDYRPCQVLRIFVDILDVNTLQIVGVDWD